MRQFLLSGLVLLAASLAGPVLAHPAHHASAGNAEKALGTFGVWHAYSYSENGRPVCYMAASIPFKKNRRFHRGPAYLMITERPAESSKDVVSYTSGYNFRVPSDVTLHIDKAAFSMFTSKDTAWSREPATDRAITAAIRAGARLTATGIPAQRGIRPVTDTLNIKGGGGAYHAIAQACGLEPKTLPKPPPKRRKKHK